VFGMLQAEAPGRRLTGYPDLGRLTVAVEPQLTAPTVTVTRPALSARRRRRRPKAALEKGESLHRTGVRVLSGTTVGDDESLTEKHGPALRTNRSSEESPPSGAPPSREDQRSDPRGRDVPARYRNASEAEAAPRSG